MVSALDMLTAVLALQVGALCGIGGLIWMQAVTKERVHSLDVRVSRLERKSS